MQRRYLRKLTLEEALELWLGHPAGHRLTETERVPTAGALGRVTAEPVYAARSVPHFHCSAVDGIAVRAADTFGASETSPCRLPPDAYTVLDTGDPIPPDRDAVVMIEDVRWLPSVAALGSGLWALGGEPRAQSPEPERSEVELIAAASPWQHVRLAGEDLVATEMVLTRGHRLRPADLAALLSCGVTSLVVHRRPRVVILPTGDELVDAEAPAEAFERGRIAETNSHLIAGMVSDWGGEACRGAIVPDTREALRAAILEAASGADAVAVNAGSSAGRDDYVPAMLEEMGELLAHGVDIMPGKPVALGVVGGRPVLGVPGYPVSAYVVCEQFLRPLLHQLQGLAPPTPLRVPAVIGRRTPSRIGQEEFLRVKAGRVGDRLVVVPLARGASLLNSVVRADGVIRVPARTEGLEAGAPVLLEPLRPLEEIERALLVIGSHDITLDLLADLLRRDGAGWNLSSAHVGSYAGLTALKRGECHVAGTHLLDEETGAYNLPYLERLFSRGEVALVHLVKRTQGLLVAPGNPLGIRTLADLVAGGASGALAARSSQLEALGTPSLRSPSLERNERSEDSAASREPRAASRERSECPLFINRQRGSGTRMLLDFQLKQMGIAGQEIRGYERELYTHLAVAEAVASGGADVGLAIRAAATALGLDFIPIAEERYDLAVRADAWDLPALRALRVLIASDAFRTAVIALGGYDPSESGTVLVAPGATI